jgi:hypothetical protein
MIRRSGTAIAALVVAAGVAEAVHDLRGRGREATRRSPRQIVQRYQLAPGHVRVLVAGRMAEALAGSAAAARALLQGADEHDIVPAAALARAGIQADSSMHLRAALRRIGAHLVVREDP